MLGDFEEISSWIELHRQYQIISDCYTFILLFWRVTEVCLTPVEQILSLPLALHSLIVDLFMSTPGSEDLIPLTTSGLDFKRRAHIVSTKCAYSDVKASSLEIKHRFVATVAFVPVTLAFRGIF